MGKKSLMMGFYIGRLIAGMPKKTVIAHRYNDTRIMPLFPEYDPTEYPYVYVVHGLMEVYLYLSTQEMRLDKNEYGNNCLRSVSGEGKILKYEWEWLIQTLVDPWALEREYDYASGFTISYTPAWCNKDIYNVDGTLFLAGSELMPVYNVVEKPAYDDTFPIEWIEHFVKDNAKFTYDDTKYVKVSNLTPTTEKMKSLVFKSSVKCLYRSETVADGFVLYEYQYDSRTKQFFIVVTDSTLAETGIYAQNPIGCYCYKLYEA